MHIRLPTYRDVCGASEPAKAECAATPQLLELVVAHGSATPWAGQASVQLSCPPNCPKNSDGGERGNASSQDASRRRLRLTMANTPAASSSGFLRSVAQTPPAGDNNNDDDDDKSSTRTSDESFMAVTDPASVAAIASVGGILYSEPCTTGRTGSSLENATIRGATPRGNLTGNNSASTEGSFQPFDTLLATCLDHAVAATRCAFGQGAQCVLCPVNARCPGGRRAWPAAGYWSSNESTSQMRLCAAPGIERCRGMIHGSLSMHQCGRGYKGVDCARCVKDYYEDAVTGRCLRCSGNSGGDGDKPSLAHKASPLFYLIGALVLVFLAIAGIVHLIKRRNGGTLGAGMQRAFHFIIYVVVLFQTTMVCSSTATREVVDGANAFFRTKAKGDAEWRFLAEAIGRFYSAFNVFQLDFSDAVQLPCLDLSPFLLETVYASIVYVVLTAWLFIGVFVTLTASDRGNVPPVRPMSYSHAAGETQDKKKKTKTKKTKLSKTVPVGEEADEGTGEEKVPEEAPEDERVVTRVGLRHQTSHTGHSNKWQRKLASLQHRLNTGGYVLYAVTCKIALQFLHCPVADMEADCHTERPAALVRAMWGLVVFHLILFPLGTFFASARVHRRLMGGSCCSDSEDTRESQVGNRPTGLEVALWRYFVHSDLQSRFFWFRHCNMGLLLVLLTTHIYIQALPSSTNDEKVRTDLARSLIQTAVVFVYLVVIISLRPYVTSRARFWKFYVSTFNKGTTFLIVVARLVAEQARGYASGIGALEGNQEEARDRLRAGLVLMVISCVACAVQFMVSRVHVS